MFRKAMGIVLVVLGVVLNNVVYLQDLWLGQAAITLDGWKAIAGILVSLGMVAVGLLLVVTSRPNR